MALQKKWEAISAALFTLGSRKGEIILAPLPANPYRVKMKITLSHPTNPVKNFIINRVVLNSLFLGEEKAPITDRADLAGQGYNAGGLTAVVAEQDKSIVDAGEIDQYTYEQDPVNAERAILVDSLGRPYSIENPLPSSATISGDVTIGDIDLEAFTSTPDNVLSVGSDDGTKTGVKRAHKIGSDGKLEVKDTTAKTVLDAIVSALGTTLKVDDDETQSLLSAIGTLLSGTLKVDDDETQSLLNTIATALSGTITVSDTAVAALLTASNSILTSINTQLTTGTLKVDDDQAQTILTNILTQLNSGGITIGTEDGTLTGVQHVFTNNLRKMITGAHNSTPTITWLDIASKKNRRADKIEWTSSTFPGFTVRKQFSYTLAGGDYVPTTTGTWSII